MYGHTQMCRKQLSCSPEKEGCVVLSHSRAGTTDKNIKSRKNQRAYQHGTAETSSWSQPGCFTAPLVSGGIAGSSRCRRLDLATH